MKKSPQKNKGKQVSRHTFNLPVLPLYPILFVLLWIFCSFIYGDVFYICQQHTYFAFDSVLLKDVMRLWYGPAVVMGRFLMLAFHYPIVGGALYALILTGIAYGINYTFGLKNYFTLVGVVVPLAWLVFLVSLRLNIYYHYEPSFLMYVPVLVFILLGIIVAVKRFVGQSTFPSLLKTTQARASWLAVLVVVGALGYTSFWIMKEDQNTYITARLQRELQNYDWDAMIETAQKAERPTRPICAYYATALGYTNQLEQHLFDVYFQYPNAHLTNRNDFEDIGTFFYMADLYLYMGLANPSWHRNIDHLEMEGLTAYKLKNLYLTALVNGETTLANKIIYLIEQMPLEGGFVEKYKPMLYDRKLIAADPVLGKVQQILPRKDAIEQQFFVPLFLGYYVDGCNFGVLPKGTETISMAASLYTKRLDSFMYYLSRSNWSGTIPSTFEEAVYIYYKSQGRDNGDTSPVINTMRQLFSEARMLPKDKKERARALKETYLGTYTMYYFYENVPDENYAESQTEGEGLNKVN